MKSSLIVFALLFASLPAVAGTVSCPDLAQATQVAACPAEEELKYTFTGYCSDNSRGYKDDSDVCADYQRYRKLKNIALWESGDGAFNAYVSCDLAPQAVKASRPASVTVGRQGKMTLLVCGYRDGVKFTHRTRAQCKPAAAQDCAADPAACKASCE